MSWNALPTFFFMGLLGLGLSGAGCRKWVTKDVKPAQDTSGNRDGDDGKGDKPGVIIGGDGDGFVAIIMKKVTKDDESYFKNCIKLEVEGGKPQGGTGSDKVKVGCNKQRNPDGDRYLTVNEPYKFQVAKGSSPKVRLHFTTWIPIASSCISYGDPRCNDNEPYKGETEPDATQIFPSASARGIKCFRERDQQLYHIYFEDQKTDAGGLFDRDTQVRAKLLTESGGEVLSFDPLVTDRDSVYKRKAKMWAGPGTDCVNSWLADKNNWIGNPRIAPKLQASADAVPERALQACFGIDYSDLIFDLHAQDATIVLDGASCATL